MDISDFVDECSHEYQDSISLNSRETDLVDQWVNNTVENGVVEGAKIREQKIKAFLQQDNLIQKLKLKPASKTKRYRSPDKHKCHKLSNKCDFRCLCPKPGSSSKKNGSSASTRPNHIKSNKRSKKKTIKQSKCPVRVAELAIPSKRQCLATWRTNYHILPACMIDRLKQYVTDERPLVLVKDAVECFRRGGHLKKKKRKKAKTASREICRLSELKYVCAVFMGRASRKLIPPMNILLPPHLQRIYNIVYYDTWNIVKKSISNTEQNRRMHDEVTKKIVIWMRQIIEESCEKLQEEEFKDFEAEEGHILDIIDDVIDAAMEALDTESDNDTSIKDSSLKSSDSESEHTHGTVNTKDDIDNIIDDIINGANLEEEHENENAPESEHENTTESEHENEHESENKSEHTDHGESQTDIPSGYEDDNSDVSNKSPPEENDSHIIDDAIGDNVHENEDERPDESEHNEGNGVEEGGPNNIDSKRSSTILGSDKSIVVSEPNTDLLSEVDEIWPDDIDASETGKITATVSRSVSSLGNIAEDDENAKDPKNDLNKDSVINTDVYPEKDSARQGEDQTTDPTDLVTGTESDGDPVIDSEKGSVIDLEKYPDIDPDKDLVINPEKNLPIDLEKDTVIETKNEVIDPEKEVIDPEKEVIDPEKDIEKGPEVDPNKDLEIDPDKEPERDSDKALKDEDLGDHISSKSVSVSSDPVIDSEKGSVIDLEKYPDIDPDKDLVINPEKDLPIDLEKDTVIETKNEVIDPEKEVIDPEKEVIDPEKDIEKGPEVDPNKDLEIDPDKEPERDSDKALKDEDLGDHISSKSDDDDELSKNEEDDAHGNGVYESTDPDLQKPPCWASKSSSSYSSEDNVGDHSSSGDHVDSGVHSDHGTGHDKGSSNNETSPGELSTVINKSSQDQTETVPIDDKVEMETAPSWVINIEDDKEKPEPSEEEKYTIENKKWCDNLITMFINLEKGHTWIEQKCDKIMIIHQKGVNRGCYCKVSNTATLDWINLNKSIEDYMTSWDQVYKKALRKLKNRSSQQLHHRVGRTNNSNQGNMSTQKTHANSNKQICQCKL